MYLKRRHYNIMRRYLQLNSMTVPAGRIRPEAGASRGLNTVDTDLKAGLSLVVTRDGRANVNAKTMAAIIAAVQAYIEHEDTGPVRRKGHGPSPWKMGARREQLGRRSLAARANPLKTRLNRFSLR